QFVVVEMKKANCVYDFLDVDGGGDSPTLRQSRPDFSNMIEGFTALRQPQLVACLVSRPAETPYARALRRRFRPHPQADTRRFATDVLLSIHILVCSIAGGIAFWASSLRWDKSHAWRGAPYVVGCGDRLSGRPSWSRLKPWVWLHSA